MKDETLPRFFVKNDSSQEYVHYDRHMYSTGTMSVIGVSLP